MPVIGYLSEAPASAHTTAAFQRGMAELGYVEGKKLRDRGPTQAAVVA
jgi:hypothetical protein